LYSYPGCARSVVARSRCFFLWHGFEVFSLPLFFFPNDAPTASPFPFSQHTLVPWLIGSFPFAHSVHVCFLSAFFVLLGSESYRQPLRRRLYLATFLVGHSVPLALVTLYGRTSHPFNFVLFYSLRCILGADPPPSPYWSKCARPLAPRLFSTCSLLDRSTLRAF